MGIARPVVAINSSRLLRCTEDGTDGADADTEQRRYFILLHRPKCVDVHATSGPAHKPIRLGNAVEDGTGGAPTLSQSTNGANEFKIVGQNYDANGNGNQTSGINGTLADDSENRVVSGQGTDCCLPETIRFVVALTACDSVGAPPVGVFESRLPKP